MATRASGLSARRDIAETLWPPATAREDGLPPLLIVLTIVTGVLDALAYLRLGHVFVANMTGNVVFLGFAAAGASGLSVPGSLLALAFFLCGGIAAGRVAGRLGEDRRQGLRVAVSVELALSAVAVAVAAFAGQHLGAGSRYALITLLALAMGVQNATAPRLAVADLTTTVLTLTLTGIAADSWLGGASGSDRPARPRSRRDAARRAGGCAAPAPRGPGCAARARAGTARMRRSRRPTRRHTRHLIGGGSPSMLAANGGLQPQTRQRAQRPSGRRSARHRAGPRWPGRRAARCNTDQKFRRAGGGFVHLRVMHSASA